MKRLGWCLLVFSAFCGCSSTPPISYYTLDMTPSGKTEIDGNLNFEGIRSTEALSRSQIQIHATATKIEYYATHEWAGGLGQMLRRKLEVELPSSGHGSLNLTLTGTLLECAQVDLGNGAEARMKLAVIVRDATAPRYETPLIRKTYAATQTMAKRSPDNAVRALSRCSEKIAGEIAADIAKLTR